MRPSRLPPMLGYVLLVLAVLSAVNASKKKSTERSKSSSDKECSISMKTDLPKDSRFPLILKRSGFILPETVDKENGGVLKIKVDQQVTLACPGKHNEVSKFKESAVEATCTSRGMLKVNGKSVDVADLACSKIADASLRITEKSCEQNGVILELGFQINDKKWVKMVDLCHQIDEGNTLWARHVLHGAALDGAEKESNRPSFDRADKALYNGYNPNSMYTKSNERTMLEKVLGRMMTDKLMERDNSNFLSRGHLAPDADFIFGSWQFLTYFYANVAPQWQSFNAGNWLATEKNVREKAIELGRDLLVYTGTQGILTLPNQEGEPTPLYLYNAQKKIPIPDNFWKVLYDMKTRKAIVLVGSNNPLRDSEDNLLCTNVCETYGWRTIRDFWKGLIYCCTLEDFQMAVSYAPKLSVSGVLTGPTFNENKEVEK